MKKIILLTSFLAFLTFSKAQDLKNLRVGLVFSNAILFPTSDNVNIENIISYDFDYGLSVDYFLTENYAISSGVYIDNPFYFRKNGIKHFESDFFQGDSTYASKNNLTSEKFGNLEKITGMYLNIPISFKLKSNEIGYFKYFGDIGVLNSFTLKTRYSLKDTEIQKVRFENTNLEFPINYHSTFYNFSLKIGGGIEYTISDKTALLVGLYFYNGFTDIIEDSDGKATYLRKLSLRTGILF